MSDVGSEGVARLALAALAAGTLGLLWLGGSLSAALFGGGWSTISAARLIGVAIRLPAHLGDPRAAWPLPMREAMPAALGFYLTLGLLVAVLIGLALAASRLAGRFGVSLASTAKSGRAASARWARARELRPLLVRGPEPGRLLLGRRGRRLLAAEQRQSVIVVGPAQCGKTSGLVIPALLEWEGPALATSVKSDLLLDTYARRDQLGRAMVFDPIGATNRECVRSNPLRGCGSWQGALRVAHWLCSAARQGGAGLADAEFWYAAAEKLLAPLLFAAALKGEAIGSVVRWLDRGKEARIEVETILAEAEGDGKQDCLSAKLAWQASWNRDERQRSSIYTTAETITAAFADPRVQQACSRSDYSPAGLLHGANTLYLCAPAHEQERLRPLFSMMIRELVSLVYEEAAAKGHPLEPPLLLVLDELANIAPVPNLDEIASTGAGQGIQLLSVFQDLAQLRSRYGESAQTIVNNHRAKLFGSGISDPDTLSFVSRVVGSGEFRDQSATADPKGSITRTESSIYRELTPAKVVREGAPGSALLLYGHLPPTRIRLRPFFEERKLRRSRRVDRVLAAKPSDQGG